MEIDKLKSEIEELKQTKKILQTELIELDDKILFQEFGIYHPQYDYVNLDFYSEKLKEIKKEQKEMIKKGTAAVCCTSWKVQGSEEAGKKMIAENIKQIIRNFNIESDLCISKVKFNNYESSKERIYKAFELQNRLNEMNDIHIADDYYGLKIKELNLTFEYEKKKKEKREEERRLREERKEEEKVLRELEEKRKELEKEQEHYINNLNKIHEQLKVEKSEERKIYLESKRHELNENIDTIEIALRDLDYREANHKAGYVYVISNIGSFGEDIYKIGMTRRLDPNERIAELSGASVPFKFDIHAMIFSDDAPKLEAALHKHFETKKVNLVNGRKEFFNVTLEEIKKVVLENHDKTVEFINLPEAEQYRESLMMRKKAYK